MINHVVTDPNPLQVNRAAFIIEVIPLQPEGFADAQPCDGDEKY
jgi:hypothetical protein